MPGLAAYLGTHPAAPVILTEAATNALKPADPTTTGEHGWATNHGTHRTSGPFDHHRFTDTTTSITWLIAHAARRATSPDPERCQPVTVDGHTVAVLGDCYNRADLNPHADSTAHALAHVYADLRDLGLPPESALEALIEAANMPAHALIVRDTTGVLLAHRQHIGLWAHADHAAGTYLATQSFASAAPLPTGQPLAFTPAPRHAQPPKTGKHHRPSTFPPSPAWPPPPPPPTHSRPPARVHISTS